jgi:hypothetical protein
MKRQARSLAITAVATGLVLAPALGASAAPENPEAGLQAVRAWTAKYHDVNRAIADGFVPSTHCDPGMGYHYVNFDRFDDRLIPSKPEVLLYAPDGEGGVVLVGAEWVVVDEDQDLSTDQENLAVFGHEMVGPMLGHFPGMPIHYDLHAYAWLPGGGFVTANPSITC